ncbi:hypothetical protein [Methanothrix sp.]|uniref:hypothetical protein n=1 Tax=Methanothrix sp. TaxID=90426 RepID=UPI003C755A5C
MCHARGMVFERWAHHGLHHHGVCCCTGSGRVSGREELIDGLKEYRDELKRELERVEAKLRSLQPEVKD